MKEREGFEKLQRLLDAAAREERETRAEAGRLAHLRAPSVDPPAARRPRRLVVALLAAASIVLVGVLGSGLLRDADPEPAYLGPEVEILHPAGAVERYAPISLAFDLPPGGWFEIRVEAATPERDGEVLVTGHRTSEARWSPPEDRHGAWPDRVRVHVAAFDAGGRRLAGASSTAWR